MNDEVVHCRRRVEAAWPACTAGVAKEAVYHPAMKTWHHPLTVPRNENAAKPSSTARYVKANSVRSISQCRSSSRPSPHLFPSHIFISSLNSSIWKKKAQTQRKETQKKKSNRQWTNYVAWREQVPNQNLVTCQADNSVRSTISV